MDKQQALKHLCIMRDWHEDNGDGPNADYNAICFAIEAIERSEDLEKLITALETEHAKLRELQKAQPEIIRCRECKFASGDSRICMKFGHSPIGELDFCAWAERRTDEV